MGMSGISKSQVSKLCKAEAAPFWIDVLRSLTRRGLKGVKLVISDAHEGLKAAITQVMGATWQRCGVHTLRNLLARAPTAQQSRGATTIRDVFVQPTQEKARELWRAIAASAHNSLPKLVAAMDAAEDDVLAYMTFPAAHRAKLHSTNTLERLNKEVKRRADVVGVRRAILPPEGWRLLLTPQRGLDHPTDRRRPDGTERRLVASAPLSRPRTPHRIGRRRRRSKSACPARRSRHTYTAQGLNRLSEGQPKFPPLRWT
jgi:hypothetical protein